MQGGDLLIRGLIYKNVELSLEILFDVALMFDS